MDPYLEARWTDVHGSMLQSVKQLLQPMLPEGLRARTEERIFLEEDDGEHVSYRRDVVIVQGRQSPRPSGAAALAKAPLVVEFPNEAITDTWLQIIDTRNGNKVVTAIELLSPANKAAGPFDQLYQRKVHDYGRAGVNLVEIDLLRCSRARLKVRWSGLPIESRGSYLICVRRGSSSHRWECVPFSIRDPIPDIVVPLREGDPDLKIALRPAIEHAYVAGAHDDIDYNQPPDRPLSAEDEAWADQLLRSAGRRK
jgi:hypothetical protein